MRAPCCLTSAPCSQMAALLALLLCAPATQAAQLAHAGPVPGALVPGRHEKITVDGRPTRTPASRVRRHGGHHSPRGPAAQRDPEYLQARVKVRWDDDYFYVGAVLHESYVTAENVGHGECSRRWRFASSPPLTSSAPRIDNNAGQQFRDLHRRQRHDAVLHGVRDVRAECDVRHQVGQARRNVARVRQRRVLARARRVNTTRGYAGLTMRMHPGPMAMQLNNTTRAR